MTDYRAKLQGLLYELFQFDSADLDFGFYAVMNRKRDQVAHFIEHDLLDAVQEGLQILAAESQDDARNALAEAKAAAIRGLGDDAFDGEKLDESLRNTRLGKAYLQAKEAFENATVSAEVEAQIFNDLYQFFARYYQDGDFISQRRYGRSDKYAVPYNGEEVHLHWANYDQYYVKTGTHFTNYSFTVPGSIGLKDGASVQVKIAKIDVERDNVKGDKRFFIFAEDQSVTWDEENQTLTIPFEYRALTPEESKRVGTRNQQDKLLAEAHKAIIDAVPNQSLKAQLTSPDTERKSDKDRLAYHLNRYAAENTRDFFVHKDLGGFLRRELDYFLKNEVIRLDDIDLDNLGSVRQAGARAKTIRTIGGKVIAFLDQLESFQRRLFLKRKFVLQSDYCLTLDKIPADVRADFYPEILANARQLEEWKQLYGVEIKPDTDLKEHPHLMLDTAFFDIAFKLRLLATFDDLDSATNGLLVHAENLQALNLLTEKYRKKIDCIHIDPPYNTQTSGFLYKNSYQHSSWLTMMDNRISAGTMALSQDGSYLCHIDENEYERLQLLFEHFDLPDAGTIVWDKKNPMNAGKGVALQHEYVVWRSALQRPAYLQNKNVLSILAAASKIVKKYGKVTEEARKEFADWASKNPDLSGGERAYRYLDDDGKVYQSVSLRAPEPRTDPKFHQPLIHPTTQKPCPVPPNGFSRTPKTLKDMLDGGEIIFGVDESTQPRQKKILTKEYSRQIPSLIRDGHKGKADLSPLGLDFPYCHPVSLYVELIGAALESPDSIVLDCFAGSGTTGHAVIELNREDSGNRNYIMIEMGEQFDTTLRPRIQKITYASDWSNGKPVAPKGRKDIIGQSHMFQYMRLESYDDTFHNIRFQDTDDPQESLLSQMPDYLLSYFLEQETAGSPTLLNIAQFDRPFEYQLLVTGQGGVLSPQPVDLATTFNFLLGLTVHTLRHFERNGQPYVRVTGTNPEGRKVCIVWRNVPPVEEMDAERDWLNTEVLADIPCDKLYLNGESTLANALSTEEEFKRRMFEGVS